MYPIFASELGRLLLLAIANTSMVAPRNLMKRTASLHTRTAKTATTTEEAKNDSVRVRDGYGEMLNLLSLKSHAGD